MTYELQALAVAAAARVLPGVGQALADTGFADADVEYAVFRSGNLNVSGPST